MAVTVGRSLGDNAVTILESPPTDPLATVRQEVLDEFERVHLLLRTSARLREKHGD